MRERLEDFSKKQHTFLLSSGAYFWLPWLTEKRFFLLRILTAIVCGGCGVGVGVLIETGWNICLLIGCGSAVLGLFLPGFVFKVSDARDNEQMTADIRKLYEYVKIQVKAGMYLTNTLSACYLAISNRRLKQGLLELNSRLIATNSIPIAISEFGEKFTNEYIAYFCLIVNQSEKSGRMAQMLSDMTRQMEDLEKYMMTQKKGRMERKVLFLTLFVFVGILLIAAYQLAASLLSSVSGIMS